MNIKKYINSGKGIHLKPIKEMLEADFNLAKEALKIFNANKETMVAKYIIDNPDIKMDEITLVQGMKEGNLAVWIERKDDN